MSNYLAIATVTATLEYLLHQAVGSVPGAEVTTLRPGSINDDNSPKINLFLYQVARNPSLQGIDLPTRNASGHAIRPPETALDLYYLLTFLGDDSQLEPQRLLGNAVSVLHAQPVLTRKEIDSATVDRHYLEDSDLADQVELVRFWPLNLDLEELSRLWSNFFQVSYALSVIYRASVVLIESRVTLEVALPVENANVMVSGQGVSVIVDAIPQGGGNGAIVKGSTILLKGMHLGAGIDWVSVGTARVAWAQSNSGQVTVKLDGDDLRAGLQSVYIVYKNKTTSNKTAVMLRPQVLSVKVSLPADTGGPSLELETDCAIAEGQNVVLLLNEIAQESPSSYSIKAPTTASNLSGNTITIPLGTGVKSPATYLVRLEVDHAASILDADVKPGSPTLGEYVKPAVTIP